MYIFPVTCEMKELIVMLEKNWNQLCLGEALMGPMCLGYVLRL